MVLGSRGYIFTLIVSLLVLITLSLILFYTEISAPSFEDRTKRMGINELHYFVESLKKDAGRASAISAERAAAYATNHVINTNETMRNYFMVNCTALWYSSRGADAAIAELMICGTLENASKPSSDADRYMEDNTILSWIDRVNSEQYGGIQYNNSVKLRNLTIVAYDSFSYAVIGEYDFVVEDRVSGNRFAQYGTPVVSLVDVTAIEDPMMSIHYNIPAAIKPFRRCGPAYPVNGSVLDEWVENGCYNPASAPYGAPSFFDRLEGRDSLDPRFSARAVQVLGGFNYTPGDLGLESMINLHTLIEYNVQVNANLSQVDHVYWKGVDSRCTVDGMLKHPEFRIDVPHAVKYKVSGLDCAVDVIDNAGVDSFSPLAMSVPNGTTVSWYDRVGTVHQIWSDAWGGAVQLEASGRYPYKFNRTGTFTVMASLDGSTWSDPPFILTVT
jgi:hypothetical protein